MTVVRIDLRTPTPGGTVPRPDTLIVATPHARLHVDGDPDYVVMPDPVPLRVRNGILDWTVDHPGYWWIEDDKGRRLVLVPDQDEPVNYGDLTVIDPESLDPAVPSSPAWTAALAAEIAARAAGDVHIDSRVVALEDAPNPSWDGITGKPSNFTPTAHTHAQSDVTGLAAALDAKASAVAVTTGLAGKADLVDGVIPTSQIPALALTSGQVVANRAGLLALTTTQPGDIVVISGTADRGTYIQVGEPASAWGSWLLLNAPTDVVLSVNGQTGTVVLGPADVAAQPASANLAALDITSTPLGRSLLAATAQASTNDLASVLSSLGLRSAGTSFAGRYGTAVRTAAISLGTSSPEFNACDATTGSFTVSLPTAAANGLRSIVKKIDASANTVTVNAGAGGAIDGLGETVVLRRQGDYVEVTNTGTAQIWRVTGGNVEEARTRRYSAGMVPGQFYNPVSPGAVQNVNGTTLVLGTLRLAPFIVTEDLAIDRLSINVTTAGPSAGAVRLAIYADDGTGYPGALVVGTAALDATTTGAKAATIANTLTPGLYWIGGVVQGDAATTIGCLSGSVAPVVPIRLGTVVATAVAATAVGYSMTGVTGACPATFAAAGPSSGAAPRVTIRAA